MNPQKNIEFKNALKDFIRFLKTEKRLSGKTLESYQSDLKQFSEILPLKVLDDISLLDENTLGRFFQAMKKTHSITSIIRMQSVLRSFFRFLKEDKNILTTDLPELISYKKKIYFPDFLTLQQVQNILKTFHTDIKELTKNNNTKFQYLYKRDEIIIKLLYAAGLRVSECVNLNAGDISDEKHLRIRGKGGKVRMIPLYNQIFHELHEYKTRIRPAFKTPMGETALFLNKNNKRISRISIWKMIKKRAQKAGIQKKVFPHTLRHTFATHLIQNGADLRSVQELLGHSDIRTTELYTHLDTKALKNVIQTFHPLYH